MFRFHITHLRISGMTRLGIPVWDQSLSECCMCPTCISVAATVPEPRDIYASGLPDARIYLFKLQRSQHGTANVLAKTWRRYFIKKSYTLVSEKAAPPQIDICCGCKCNANVTIGPFLEAICNLGSEANPWLADELFCQNSV